MSVSWPRQYAAIGYQVEVGHERLELRVPPHLDVLQPDAGDHTRLQCLDDGPTIPRTDARLSTFRCLGLSGHSAGSLDSMPVTRRADSRPSSSKSLRAASVPTATSSFSLSAA